MSKNKDFISDTEISFLEDKFIKTYLSSEKKPIKLMCKLYLRYWKELLGSMIFYLIKQLPVLCMPLVVSNVIDAVFPTEAAGNIGQDPTEVIIKNVIFIISLLIINIPANAIYVKLYSRVTRKVEAGLRGAIVKKLQQLSISFHKEMQSGRIQSKIMRDVDSIHMFATQLITTLPSVILNIATALTVVITKEISVFFFFLLCIPVNITLVRMFRKKINKSNSDYRRDVEGANASFNDMEEMIQITRAHSLEEHEIHRIGGSLTKIAISGFNLDMIQAYFGSFLWVTIQIFQLGSLIFSGFMAYQGKISAGDITLFQTYFNTLTWQVSALINLFPIFSKGTEAISSIGEILGSRDIECSSGKEKIDTLRGEYEFDNVTFSYETEGHLLDNFSLSVKAGETVALVGESGSGKSTLINLAIGFMHPQSGKITVDGKDLTELDLQSYRRNIAIVPQNSVLFTGSIRENITYGLENVNEDELNEVLKASLLYDFINTLPHGIDSSLNEHGANLSGGQKQRISIARALIRDPSVIILDEATSALDNVSEREIQRAINNLRRNRTTFIVAHRLSTIRNADKIAVLKAGRCVELGTYDELLALDGEFAKMHKASEKSIDDIMSLN